MGLAALLLGALWGAAAEPQYGGELVYAVGAAPELLFPGYSVSSADMEIWLYVYENLVELDEHSQIVPCLAKSWEFSSDYLMCTMHLQQGVSFSDGTPFNASAVKFVFDETVAKKFQPLKLLDGLDKVEAIDEDTVVFRFKYPVASFLPNLAYRALAIWSPAAYKEHGPDWMKTNLVGTGPFLFEEWKHGESIRFVKNASYWRPGLPYLDSIKIIFVPETASRAMMLETGAVDRTISLGDYDAARLASNPKISIRTTSSTRQYYLILNHHKHPFDNRLVRMALNYAVDKEGIIASVFAGVGASLPLAPILTPGVVAFSDMTEPGDTHVYPYDLDMSRRLFKKAGYEDRDGDGILEDLKGNDLKLSLWGPRGRYKGDAELAELVQTMLREVGVDVSLRIMEHATYYPMLRQPYESKEYEMGVLSWGIPTADPDEVMKLMFHSESGPTMNFSCYANLEVDRLANLARTQVDLAERTRTVAEWAELVLYDAPIVFLPSLNLNLGSRTYVHGDRILPTENYPASFAWIDKDEKARQGINR
jgi:ABC-type transport system substrate-binding protein